MKKQTNKIEQENLSVEVTDLQAKRITEAISAKQKAEQAYRDMVAREQEIVELVCDAHGLKEVKGINLEGKVLHYVK